MIYEHDPEFPFRKVLVKDGSEVIGVVRRNLKTGRYQFYDGRIDSITPLFKADRLEHIKSWVNAQYAA